MTTSNRQIPGDPSDLTVVTCPRRINEHGPWEKTRHMDRWAGPVNGRTCSFCGSLHPDDFMRLAKDGTPLDPTDKNYKVYAGGSRKFYFQHLSEDQRVEFFRAHMAGEFRVGPPGRFYVLPFFFGGLTR